MPETGTAPPSAPRRILIVGCCAAGKSTLGRALATRYGLPVIHLDRHFWRPGWVQPPPDEWRETCRVLAADDRWIMDGNYGSSLDLRLPRADLIVHVDPTRWLCLYRALTRRWRYRSRSRDDLPPGCPEKIDWQFLRYIWSYPRHHRPRLYEQIATHAPHTPLIHLTTRRAIRTYQTTLATPSPEPPI